MHTSHHDCSRSILGSAIDVIGSTPAVELSRLTRGLEGRIVAKLEFLNPGFSKKDRIAKQIIEDAKTNGTKRLTGGSGQVQSLACHPDGIITGKKHNARCDMKR
jgi:hypothetical protein